MNLDSNGLPLTINDKGWDGGDSLANYCRWKIAEYALDKQTNPMHLKALLKIEIDQTGLMRRHPGSGYDPSGTPIVNVPDFWTNPKELSRDNSRGLHWIMAMADKTTDVTQQVLARVFLQYKSRGYLKAQNNDVMLPTQLCNNGWSTVLRDTEILLSVFVQIGLIPTIKHDKPWGFGKGKKIKFTWQDEDEVDGDANLTCDLTSASLINRTRLLSLACKLYKKFRGSDAVKRYYRAESGNNQDIGLMYSVLVNREFKV